MRFVRRWLVRVSVVVLLGVPALTGPVHGAAGAPREAQASEERLRRDVTFLASPQCEGRGPLTSGIEKAANYVANQFKEAGLRPGVAGSYFQTFSLPANIKEGPATLVLKGPAGQVVELKEGTHFQALGLGGAGKVTDAPVAFAGYGISSATAGLRYNDYGGLDVKGKVVFVLRDVPRTASKDAPRELRQHAAFVRKLAVAETNKAAALLIVNDATTARPGDDLIDFNFTALGKSNNKLPAMHVRRSVLDDVLQSSAATTLADVEQAIDRDFQPKSRPLTGWTASLEVKSRPGQTVLKNVVGVLEGRGPLAKETIVVGAHYDHLGYGGASSRAGSKRMAMHPGADDNGSGTTAVMELARRFAAIPNREGRRLVFIAFSGEEIGLKGSAYYCAHPLFPLASTVAMYNLDMVGRLSRDAKTGKDKLLSEGSGTAKEFKGLIEGLAKKYDFQHSGKASGFGPSDHASFCAKKMPVLFFWTGYHPDYHMPSDTADKINVKGMRRIVDMSVDAVAYLTSVEPRPAFVEVKGSGGVRPSKGPRLGIRPGYDEDVAGVLVGGVSAGEAADRAGVKSGDVIVQIAGRQVKNLQTYMEAMAPQKPGSTIEVVVTRGGKRVPLRVKLD